MTRRASKAASWWCGLAALLIVVGILLSPMRAMAATAPMLVVTVRVVWTTATTQLGGADAVRREAAHPSINAYDAARSRYDDLSNARVAPGLGEAGAYDGHLEHAERHELGGAGAIQVTSFDAPAAEGVASSAANGPRLAMQLAQQEAESAFTATGELSPQAIQGATRLFAPGELGNPAIPQGFGKFTTQTFQSPSGPFQVHFYMDASSGETFYGLDYKAIFNGEGGPTYFQPFSGSAP
jgi:hypothetical protein